MENGQVFVRVPPAKGKEGSSKFVSPLAGKTLALENSMMLIVDGLVNPHYENSSGERIDLFQMKHEKDHPKHNPQDFYHVRLALHI